MVSHDSSDESKGGGASVGNELTRVDVESTR